MLGPPHGRDDNRCQRPMVVGCLRAESLKTLPPCCCQSILFFIFHSIGLWLSTGLETKTCRSQQLNRCTDGTGKRGIVGREETTNEPRSQHHDVRDRTPAYSCIAGIRKGVVIQYGGSIQRLHTARGDAPGWISCPAPCDAATLVPVSTGVERCSPSPTPQTGKPSE